MIIIWILKLQSPRLTILHSTKITTCTEHESDQHKHAPKLNGSKTGQHKIDTKLFGSTQIRTVNPNTTWIDSLSKTSQHYYFNLWVHFYILTNQKKIQREKTCLLIEMHLLTV